MPIITCPKCPTRMKVPDGVSGNTKCPKCGTIFPINTFATPAFEVVDEPAAPAPNPPAPPPRKAVAKAEIDEKSDTAAEKPKKRVAAIADDEDEDDRPRKKRNRDDDDEEETRAKKKRNRDDDDEEDDQPRKKKKFRDDDEDDDRPRSRRRRDEDDEDDEEPLRRRKKKKRRSGAVAVLAFLGIGLACMLLLGGLIWLLWPSSGVGGNVRYLPDNSQVVASIKVEELLNSKAYKQIKDEFPKAEANMETESEFGLALADIANVLVGGGKSGDKPEFVVVVQTTRAVKAEDLIAKIKNNKFTKETIGGYTLYTRGTDALCVAESKVVLLGEPEGLRKVLKRDGKPNFSEGMQAAIKEADFSKTIAVAVNVKDLLPKGGKGGANPVGMPFAQGADEYLKDVEGLGGWISVKTDINWKFSLIFKDNKTAADAKKLFDGISVAAKKAKGLPPELTDFVDKLEFKLNGSRVEWVGGIEISKILKMVKSVGGKF